jgi:uncharacterized protein YneF (UPF0154 family)
MVMLVLAMSLFAGFIVGSFLGRDINDDDDMDGGMLVPASTS